MLTYNSYISILEKKESLRLFHGSLEVFNKFQDKITFFTRSPQFAYNYASQKSMDMGADKDVVLYDCNVNADFFDITDENDYKNLENLLPDKIKVYFDNFGFGSEISKKDLMFGLSGYTHVKPHQKFIDAKVGDYVPDPRYKYDKLFVIKKDDDYAYTVDSSTITEMQGYGITKDSKWYRDKEIVEIYKPFRDMLKKIVTEYGGKFEEFKIPQYYQSFLGTYNFFNIEIKDDEKAELKSILEKCKEKLIEYISGLDKYVRKYILKPEIEKLEENWRYYENDTVVNAIQKLGYNGYVALEGNVRTYAIFEPDTCVTINNINVENMEFKNADDYNAYIKYRNSILNKVYDTDRKLYDELNSRGSDGIPLIYKYYKQNKPESEII